MDGVLAGKVVVIIGGTSGLGLSAAHACVKAGARVVVTGRDASKARLAEDALGASARGVPGDASDEGSAEAAIAAARAAWGRFDGLYHVAGGSGRRHGDGPLHALTTEGWDRTLEWNLRSVFLSNRAAVRALREGGQGGSIVNCGSVLGTSPSPRYFGTHAYAAAKAAIVGMTRSAAATYAPEGIRFNVLAPGLVATPMSARAQADADIQRFVRGKQPLDGGRMGRPEDLDAAVTWLLSEGARFVTGQVVAVDGGWGVSDAGGA
jgi:NAD(P)-dependent dehydrogenase (short-subunit alcohol dehydrogenase family)